MSLRDNRMLPPGAAPFVAVADEMVERLARLEEQMRTVSATLDRLARRDADLDENLRALSERFTAWLANQTELFQENLKEFAEGFVTRDDWLFWKSLIVAAFLALVAYGWNTLLSGLHR